MESAGITTSQLADNILGRIAADLSLILDREVAIEPARVELSSARPAGREQVHVSFKLGIEAEGQARQGCLLLPLPEAVSIAGHMMMLSDQEVALERARADLDAPIKEALLEVGKYLATACDSVLKRVHPAGSVARSEGCQGVRADVRPALDYVEGEPLVVARARARVDAGAPFELILMLPEFATRESFSG